MRKPSVLGAAAILASTAALPSVAQAACAQYDPTCATYPMPSNAVGGNPGTARAEATRAAAGSYQRHRHHRDRSAYRANRTAQREAMNSRAYNNGYGPGYAGSGFWPADVAGAAVGTAGAIAAGAVNTAGAIATAPFRPANSYAYYGNGYNGWEQRSGFVCTPGTYFLGVDGLRHLCR